MCVEAVGWEWGGGGAFDKRGAYEEEVWEGIWEWE